jgi:hypothetical protein
MKDFNWLNDLLDALPDKPEYKKNVFDIAGFPRWETVNSNLLAFYLDKTEEHNFGTLFLESLLELLESKDEISLEDGFDVHREYRTEKGNYIDIVIKSVSDEVEADADDKKSQWAIILENKVDSGLHNNLNDYWKSVKAVKKLGLVLSKHTLDISHHNVKGIMYKSITHKELINQVQKNLYKYFSEANEKHLLFLKEYINNINSFYLDDVMDTENDNILRQFHTYKEQINKLKKADIKLLKYLSEQVFEVFKNYGFDPYSKKNSSGGKHFFAQDKAMNPDSFRFWVDISHLRYHEVFIAYFELHGKQNTKFGSALKKNLRDKNIFTNTVMEGIGGSDKGQLNQIFFLKVPIHLKEEQTFKDCLLEQLEVHFFNHSNNFINQAILEFEALKRSELV